MIWWRKRRQLTVDAPCVASIVTRCLNVYNYFFCIHTAAHASFTYVKDTPVHRHTAAHRRASCCLTMLIRYLNLIVWIENSSVLFLPPNSWRDSVPRQLLSGLQSARPPPLYLHTSFVSYDESMCSSLEEPAHVSTQGNQRPLLWDRKSQEWVRNLFRL